MSGFDNYPLPGESPEEITAYQTECPVCGRVTVYHNWPRKPTCDGGGKHPPVRLSVMELDPSVRQVGEDPLAEALIDVPESQRTIARELLIGLEGGEATSTHDIQEHMQLSPLALGTLVNLLINQGLVDVQDEGSPKEALRLTTRGERLLKRASAQ